MENNEPTQLLNVSHIADYHLMKYESSDPSKSEHLPFASFPLGFMCKHNPSQGHLKIDGLESSKKVFQLP